VNTPQQPTEPSGTSTPTSSTQRSGTAAQSPGGKSRKSRKSRRFRLQFDTTNGLDFRTVTPRLWKALADHNTPERLFLRGTVPARINFTAPSPQSAATSVLEELDAYSLRHEVLKVAEFYRRDRDGRVIVTPSYELMRDLLSVPLNEIPLPSITRIVGVPIVAPDGTILTQSGYHPATGTYYAPDAGLPVLDIPANPTKAEVSHAVTVIWQPLQDFPFVSDADRATAVAAMVLPFARELIDGPTPLHLFTKPMAGTGATLLVDALLTPALGSLEIGKLSQQGDESEWQRTLTAELRNTPVAILLDNVRELKSPQLAKAITDVKWHGRILGESAMAELPVRNLWVATGNNPAQHQELTRRIVRCRLDSGVERPWEGRTFRIPHLRSWLAEHRGNLVAAILTIIRAWFQAGAEKGTRRLGMFESWSEVIGGILTFAGIRGFLEHLVEQSNDDVENDVLRWVVTRWWNTHGNSLVETAVLRPWATRDGSPVLELLDYAYSDRAVQTKFGCLVRNLHDRVFTIANDGETVTLRVHRGPDHPDTHAARYQLVKEREESDRTMRGRTS